MEADKYISCAICARVCPFGVITFSASYEATLDKPGAIKCDHCPDRQRRDKVPACVEACKVGALLFGDINEFGKTAHTELTKTVSVGKRANIEEIEAAILHLPANAQLWRELRGAAPEICTS